jgi:NAD(P)-dependent dehydrogenase (short-subunit alcohol dehydrogenase family)
LPRVEVAIEAIADVWRQELEPEGVDVILIEPSAISTPIRTKAIASLEALSATAARGSSAIASACLPSRTACAARTSTASPRTTSPRSSPRR